MFGVNRARQADASWLQAQEGAFEAVIGVIEIR